ncbi:MAG: glycosyltransferase family 9 protein [Candidatus Saganbacteria bacterium]|nr:glycosyltransferase family 9 protein [Candidatus Saganbacteria bacterium]
MKNPRKILLVRPEMMGDTLLLTPLVSEIKKKFPQSAIYLLLQNPMQEITINNNEVAGYILIDKKEGFWSLVMKIKEGKFDLAIVLEDNPRPLHALACLFAGIPNRIGDKSRLLYGWTYNRGVWLDSSDQNLHQVELHGQLLKPLGISKITSPYKLVSNQESDSTAVIGLHIGTGGGNKSLTAKKYAQIATKLDQELGLSVCLLGGKREAQTFQEMKPLLNNSIISYVDQLSLSELFALIKKLKLFVGVDSGPLHIASAFQIPTIAIYTAKDVNEKRWLPWKTKNAIIISKHNCPIKCSHRECEFEYCSDGVDLNSIVAKAIKLLK